MALSSEERAQLEQAPEDEYLAVRSRAMGARKLGYQMILAVQLVVAAFVFASFGHGWVAAGLWAASTAVAAYLLWQEAGRDYVSGLDDDFPEPESPLTAARRRRVMGEAYVAAAVSLVLAVPTLFLALYSGGTLRGGIAMCALLLALLAVGHARGKVDMRDELGRPYDGPELAAELSSRSAMFTGFCATLAWLL